MNFLSGLILFLFFQLIKILKIKGSERSPSPKPGTSKDIDDKSKEGHIITQKYLQKTNFKKKRKKRKRPEDSEDENCDEWTLSDELKEVAKNAMVIEKTKIKTWEESITECLIQFTNDVEEIVNFNIMESTSTILLKWYANNMLHHTIENLNYCLRSAVSCIHARASNWEPNSFINLKLLEKQISGLIKVFQIAESDVRNAFLLQNVRDLLAFDFSLGLHHNRSWLRKIFTFLDSKKFLVLADILLMKQNDANVKIEQMRILETFLKEVNTQIMFLNTYKHMYTGIIKNKCKILCSENNIGIPIALLILYYSLRTTSPISMFFLKEQCRAFPKELRPSQKLKKNAKYTHHCLQIFYRSKMNRLLLLFVNKSYTFSDLEELIKKIYKTSESMEVLKAMNNLFYIIKNLTIMKKLHGIIEKVILLEKSPSVANSILCPQFHSVLLKKFEDVVSSLYDILCEGNNNLVIFLLLQSVIDSLIMMDNMKSSLEGNMLHLRTTMLQCSRDAMLFKSFANGPGESGELAYLSTSIGYAQRRDVCEKAERRGRSTAYFVTEDTLSNLHGLLHSIMSTIGIFEIQDSYTGEMFTTVAQDFSKILHDLNRDVY